jgi:LPXTG-motif cell wall-anchored protein
MRFSVLASVLVVGGVSSFVASGHVEAAVIPDPVTAITVTPSNPRITDPVRTDMVWCVPDSSTAGDTFEVALPPELTQLPKSFNLRDPDGILVATAVIAGTPAVATFTFNSYVDTHTGVCGTAFFESRLDSSLVPGNSYTLTYVVNHVTTFEPVITIRPGTTVTGRDTAKKGAFFDDPTDECRTVAEACLGWYIESQLGPFNSVTINDTAPAGTTFVCAQVTVRLWSVNANGSLNQTFAPAAGTVSVTCSPGQLDVVVTSVPADRLVRVIVRATPSVLDPAGGVTFVNAATVTHAAPGQGVDVDSISAQRRSALVGGDANGVVPPTTTTTTAPPAVDSPTTTSIVSALPPSPPPAAVPPVSEPQLPATGSDNTVLLAGIVVFLAGGFALAIAGSRRRKVV